MLPDRTQELRLRLRQCRPRPRPSMPLLAAGCAAKAVAAPPPHMVLSTARTRADDVHMVAVCSVSVVCSPMRDNESRSAPRQGLVRGSRRHHVRKGRREGTKQGRRRDQNTTALPTCAHGAPRSERQPPPLCPACTPGGRAPTKQSKGERDNAKKSEHRGDGGR